MIDDEKLDALDKDAADALSHTHQDPFSLVARNALLVCVGDQQQAIAELRAELRNLRILVSPAAAQEMHDLRAALARAEAERDALLLLVGVLRSQLLGTRMELSEGTVLAKLASAITAAEIIDAAMFAARQAEEPPGPVSPTGAIK